MGTRKGGEARGPQETLPGVGGGSSGLCPGPVQFEVSLGTSWSERRGEQGGGGAEAKG